MTAQTIAAPTFATVPQKSAFLRAWRDYAATLPETAAQARALLPGFTVADPIAFVKGYKAGILSKCKEMESAQILALDWSGSISSGPIGYGTGLNCGLNDCLKAYSNAHGLA